MHFRSFLLRLPKRMLPILAGFVVAACGGSADSEAASAQASSSGVDSAASTSGSEGRTATIQALVVAKPVTAATRSTINPYKGFYVSGSKLYDPNEKEFRIRGVNRVHWDDTSAGLPLSKANTERIAIDFSQSSATNLGVIDSQMLAKKIVPMPGNWAATCNTDPAALASIVDTWVAQAATWTQLNQTGLINIANEWGPVNSTAWRDAYITAIARMRAAGYTGTLVVDSGGCGQDPGDLVNYGAAVLAADPLKNILFDLHVYGNFVMPATFSWQTDYATSMAAIKATGLPVMFGEFGPGRNIGPSPTSITPEQVIATAEADGFGWMAWAWDDNDLANCRSDNNWFSMTLNCGAYTTAADLTDFGKAVVQLLQALASPASNF